MIESNEHIHQSDYYYYFYAMRFALCIFYVCTSLLVNSIGAGTRIC